MAWLLAGGVLLVLAWGVLGVLIVVGGSRRRDDEQEVLP